MQIYLFVFFFIQKNLVSSKEVKIYRGREDKDNAHFRLTFDKKTEIKQRGESCLGAPPKWPMSLDLRHRKGPAQWRQIIQPIPVGNWMECDACAGGWPAILADFLLRFFNWILIDTCGCVTQHFGILKKNCNNLFTRFVNVQRSECFFFSSELFQIKTF